MPKKKATTKPVAQKRSSKALSKKETSKPVLRRTTTKSPATKRVTKRVRQRIEPILGLAARFEAATNGFAFINSWSFDKDETEKLKKTFLDSVDLVLNVNPTLGQALTLLGARKALGDIVGNAVPEVYGLCGGMAFSALDYYNAGLPIPPGAAQPTYEDPNGKRLRDYLVRRQVDSLTKNLPTILLWIAVLHLIPSSPPLLQGGAPWMLEETKKQWKTLKKNLDNLQPTPLALIGTNPDPSMNHQVLAYDYQELDGGGDRQVRIFVYDMNCPGMPQTIEVDFSGKELAAQESCPSSQRGKLQGFICEVYSRAQPPALSGFG